MRFERKVERVDLVEWRFPSTGERFCHRGLACWFDIPESCEKLVLVVADKEDEYSYKLKVQVCQNYCPKRLEPSCKIYDPSTKRYLDFWFPLHIKTRAINFLKLEPGTRYIYARFDIVE